MKSSETFFRLPHDLRRVIYQATHSDEYRKWKRRRSTSERYSYQAFDDLRAIFVHVPKAAGMSVARSLFGGYGGGHTTIAEYQLIFPKRNFDRYFKFTFVRNPWDRALSAYRFLSAGGMNDQDERFRARHLAEYSDFSDFVRRGLTRPTVLGYYHFAPQHHFLCAPGQTRPGVDFVGYFENIRNDFKTVSRRIFGEERDLPHENRTGTGVAMDHREAYTDETRRIVGEVYAQDVAMLGYDFDNSSLGAQIAARPPVAPAGR